MVRQYIGARYVTKIYENSLDPSQAEWEASVNYEPLTMVTFNNGSYLSKKAVPASAGDPPSEPDYWVQTGFYNGQIAYLQNQIDTINGTLTSIQSQINGETYVIESEFDTLNLDGTIASKKIKGGDFATLGIDPSNSCVIGWSAYNHASNTWWSNDTAPGVYQEIKKESYTFNVSSLAAGATVDFIINNLGGVDIIGFDPHWTSTNVLLVNLNVKGGNTYVEVTNSYNTAISDTLNIDVFYILPTAMQPAPFGYNPIEVVSAKLRIDIDNEPYLQVQSVLTSQYTTGDKFRIMIHKFNNKVVIP